jgi:hypothetical protein
MARRPTYSKKSAKLQVEQLQRKCRYCKTHRNAHGFDKHEDWCKKTWMIQRELQDSELRPHSTTNQIQAEAMSLISPKIYSSLRDNNFMEGSSSMPMEVEYPSLDLHPQDSVTVTVPSGMFTRSLDSSAYWQYCRLRCRLRTSFTRGIYQNYSPPAFSGSDSKNSRTECSELGLSDQASTPYAST